MKSNYRENIKLSNLQKADFNAVTDIVNCIRKMPRNSSILILASNLKDSIAWCKDAIMQLALSSGEHAKFNFAEAAILLSDGRRIVFGNYSKLDRFAGIRVFSVFIVKADDSEVERIIYDLAPFMIELSLTNEN